MQFILFTRLSYMFPLHESSTILHQETLHTKRMETVIDASKYKHRMKKIIFINHSNTTETLTCERAQTNIGKPRASIYLRLGVFPFVVSEHIHGSKTTFNYMFHGRYARK